MALYIFSDAHLGAHSPEKENQKKQKIKELCELVQNDGDRLVILGDLFDFWFEYKHTAPKEFHDVLFMLSQLIEKGIKVDYVCGNHDFWMGDFFANQMGITLYRDEYDLEYESKKLHFIHGDGLSPKDKGYRILKKIFRNKFNIWLYRKLPPDWAYALAKKVSGSSREHTSKRDNDFIGDYKAYADTKLNSGYDVVVIGHLHIPAFDQSDNGIYINSGDFIDHFSYTKVKEGRVSLEFLK